MIPNVAPCESRRTARRPSLGTSIGSVTVSPPSSVAYRSRKSSLLPHLEDVLLRALDSGPRKWEPDPHYARSASAATVRQFRTVSVVGMRRLVRASISFERPCPLGTLT